MRRQARGLRRFFRAIDVSSAEEFYKNADEHFRWAESAKTDRERAIFLQMAAAWLKVAQKWEDVTIDTARDRLGLVYLRFGWLILKERPGKVLEKTTRRSGPVLSTAPAALRWRPNR
jgi:hypothetical protein